MLLHTPKNKDGTSWSRFIATPFISPTHTSTNNPMENTKQLQPRARRIFFACPAPQKETVPT
eukprot:12820316-Ditylum_brightwellii.AAC.1